MVVLALARIVATYSVLNNTSDEPAHIATGMEWLDHGTYDFEPLHPPMRAVFAIGPWLLGQHYYGLGSIWLEGRQILYGDGNYWTVLTSARLASLPFFLLALGIIFVWARRFGDLAALFAVLLYSTLPLALAHAGVAATDVLVTGTLVAALFVWGRWFEQPSYRLAALFGLLAASAVLSKISALPFLVAVVGVSGAMWLARAAATGGGHNAPPRFGARLRLFVVSGAIAVAVACFTFWAGYRFSLRQLWTAAGRPHKRIDAFFGTEGLLHDLAERVSEMYVPAYEFFAGITSVMQYNQARPARVFLGELSYGTPWFFPIGTLVKTPIPFLILMLVGGCLLLRRAWRNAEPMALLPPLAALAIFGVCIGASINIGMRHILPMFPLLAICAGVAAAQIWNFMSRSAALKVAARVTLVSLLSWQLIAGARIHPDYLAYYNECCEAHPDRWLVDSDLDWGQDMARLADELRTRHVDHFSLAWYWTADPDRMGLPPHDELLPYRPVHGWIAISELDLALGTHEPPYDQFKWLRRYVPVTQVGKSMRLYWLP
jgi:hypothetical protein